MERQNVCFVSPRVLCWSNVDAVAVVTIAAAAAVAAAAPAAPADAVTAAATAAPADAVTAVVSAGPSISVSCIPVSIRELDKSTIFLMFILLFSPEEFRREGHFSAARSFIKPCVITLSVTSMPVPETELF